MNTIEEKKKAIKAIKELEYQIKDIIKKIKRMEKYPPSDSEKVNHNRSMKKFIMGIHLLSIGLRLIAVRSQPIPRFQGGGLCAVGEKGDEIITLKNGHEAHQKRKTRSKGI